jgi:hypothetical protein
MDSCVSGNRNLPAGKMGQSRNVSIDLGEILQSALLQEPRWVFPVAAIWPVTWRLSSASAE